MLHLILLVLCWIFAAVAILEGTGHDDANAATMMFSAMALGTLFWLVLEGIYRWVVPFFF